MAKVIALVPDLLFGSKVLGLLKAAGIDVELASDADRLTDRLVGGDVLLVDLAGGIDGPALLQSLADAGALEGVKTLAVYSHVDVETRERARRAGCDLVVPRSRLAREGAELVARLIECSGGDAQLE
jgi:hypothetical protein